MAKTLYIHCNEDQSVIEARNRTLYNVGIAPATETTGAEQSNQLSPDHWDKLLWLAVIWIIGLEPMISAPWNLIPFGWQHIVQLQSERQSLSDPGYLLIALSTLAIIGLAVVAAFRAGKAELRRPGFPLYVAGLALSIGPFLSAFFGSNPSFSAGLLRLPALFTIVYFLPRPSIGWLARQVKIFIAVYVTATLGAAVLFSQRIIETGYPGIIPGFSIRLHGLGQHAITLASLLVLYLILDWIAPSTSKLGGAFKVVVVFCLVLTQAKVDWIAAATVLALEAWYVARVRRLYLSASLVALTVLVLVLSILSFTSNSFPIDQQTASHAISQISSLTGRTTVWRITVDVWRPNPLFGYGPSLWNSTMTLKYLPEVPWGATHAESQFFQTLGESGLIGIVGLVIYLGTLFRYGAIGSRSTAGASLALVLTMWMRALTDPILQNFVGIDLLVHVVSFATIIVAGTSVQLEGRRVQILSDESSAYVLLPGPSSTRILARATETDQTGRKAWVLLSMPTTTISRSDRTRPTVVDSPGHSVLQDRKTTP